MEKLGLMMQSYIDKSENSSEDLNMQNDNVMRIGTVRMKKAKLIEILCENKQRHDEIYKAAVEGYWTEVREKLEAKLARINKREKVHGFLDIEFPENHADDYDEAVQSLQLSVHEEVELNQNQFNAYVRNKWGWRAKFLETNTNYLNKALSGGEYVMARSAMEKF